VEGLGERGRAGVSAKAGEEIAIGGGKSEYRMYIAAGWGRIGADWKGGWGTGAAEGSCGFWSWFWRVCSGICGSRRGFVGSWSCCTCQVAFVKEGGQDSIVDGMAEDVLDMARCG